MTLPPTLSAKFYLAFSHNIIIHCQFPSTLDVTISLHFSNLMGLPTNTHTYSPQITNCYMTKACKFIAEDHNCFVCLQHLLPLQRNFTHSLCGEVFLLPQQRASSSGGCRHGRPSLLPPPCGPDHRMWCIAQTGASMAPTFLASGIGPELDTWS